MSDKRAIAAAYLAGDSTVDIAAEHGISRQRVEQIAREFSLPLRQPLKGKAGPRGKPKELATSKAARAAKNAAKYAAKKSAAERRRLEQRRPAPEQVILTDVDRAPEMPLPDTLWCQQCDMRVGRAQAHRCESPWCSMRRAA